MLGLRGQTVPPQNGSGGGGAVFVNKQNTNKQQGFLEVKYSHILGLYTCTYLHQQDSSQKIKGRVCFLVLQASEVWSTLSSFRLLSIKQTLTNWKESTSELLRCLSRSPSDWGCRTLHIQKEPQEDLFAQPGEVNVKYESNCCFQFLKGQLQRSRRAQ